MSSPDYQRSPSTLRLLHSFTSDTLTDLLSVIYPLPLSFIHRHLHPVFVAHHRLSLFDTCRLHWLDTTPQRHNSSIVKSSLIPCLRLTRIQDQVGRCQVGWYIWRWNVIQKAGSGGLSNGAGWQRRSAGLVIIYETYVDLFRDWVKGS